MKPQAVPVKDQEEERHESQNDDHHDEHIKEYSQKELNAIKLRGILCIVGGCAVHIILGTFYLWGGISPYISAYLKSYDESITQKLIQIIFPIMGVLMNSSLSFGVKLASLIGFKSMIFLGGSIISLAFLILSFITSNGAFIAIYCIFVGITSGLLYMLPIICGWKYFPLNRGIVSGVLLAAYAFGSFIFNFVCQAIANPNNDHPSVRVVEDGKTVKYFTKDVYENVPFMLRILALSYGILTVIGTLLVNYPRDLEHFEESLSGQAEKKAAGVDHTKAVAYHPTVLHSECQNIPQGLLSKPFAFLFSMVLTSVLWGMLMANSYKVYGLSVGLEDTQLTIVGSIQSASNGGSRVLWAFFLEKFGFKKLFIVLVLINILTCGVMSVAAKTFIGYLIVEMVIFSAEGGLIAAYPVISAQIFGHKVGPIMYGGLFFGIGIANMIGFILYYFLTPGIGYDGVFWIIFGINCFSLILGIFFKEEHNWAS